MGVGEGGRDLYSAAFDMKNYFLIEVWAEVRFSPRKADTVISWHFSCPPPLNTGWLLQFKAHFSWHILCIMSKVVFQTIFKFLSLATWLLCLNLGDKEGHSFTWPKSPHRHQDLWLSFHTHIAFAYWRCKNIPQLQKEVCMFPISLKYNSQFIFCYLTLFFKKKKVYSFIWLCLILVAACGIF